MDDPVPELQSEAAELGKRMWVAGQMYQTARLNHIPDHLADALVMAWWHDEITGITWEPATTGESEDE